MDLQFKYQDNAEEPFGINYYIENENESEESVVPVKDTTIPKKVTFKSQLEFDQPKPLIIEPEKPIQKQVQQKKVLPKAKKASTLKKAHSRQRSTQSKTQRKSSKKRKTIQEKSEWNSNTIVSNYFDPSLDKKRQQSAGGIKSNTLESNKKPVAIRNENGKTVGQIGKTRVVEMYRDVNQLVNEAPAPKKTFLKKGKGIQLKTQKEKTEKGKENKQIENNNITGKAEVVEPAQDPEKERMRAEFEKKNEFIQNLKSELSAEKALREQMDTEYKTKLNQMATLVKRASSAEKNPEKKEELDLVPTRDVPLKKTLPAKTNVIQRKTLPKTIVPKNIAPKIKPPVVRPLKTKPFPQAKPIKTAAPQAKSIAPQAKTIIKKEQIAPDPKKTVAIFTKEMQERELNRQIQLEAQTQNALSKIERYLNNPNAELNAASNELSIFAKKITPIIEKTDQTIRDIERIDRLKAQGTLIGMVSNIGAKYIITYADKLTDMIVEDLMQDLALQMNQIENQQKELLLSEEQQNVVTTLLENVEQLEDEQLRIQQKWLRCSQNCPPAEFEKIESEEKIMAQTEYTNPFDIEKKPANEQKKEIQPMIIYKPDRTLLLLPADRRKKIEEYKRNFTAYKSSTEGSINPDIWNIYNHITDDILTGIIDDSAADLGDILEQYLDQMIITEFQQ